MKQLTTMCNRRLGLLVLLMASWLLATTARAEQVVDLYSAEVLVTSQSAKERRRAAEEGLRKVMVRVSGNPEAAEGAEVQTALSQAEDFIYEFNYVSTSETIEVGEEARPASRLVMKFSPVEVERLLRSAQLSFWPANRPGVVVWLVTRNDEGLTRVSEGEERDWLRKSARERGVPLAMPLDDLEDRLAISARQLWEQDEEAIRNASRRYEAEAILVGRYSETSGGQWRSDWQLYHDLGDPTFYVREASLETVMSQAINETANHFAGLYAIVPREEGPNVTIMQVNGVDNFGDYKAAEHYLEALAVVRRAEVIAVRPGAMTFRLMTEGEPSRLYGMLERDRRLVPSIDSSRISLTGNRFQPEGTQTNPLVYTWR